MTFVLPHGRLMIAAAVLGACSPATTCKLEPPAEGDGRLSADGTVLRDSLGRAVYLRGLNMGGRSKFAPFSPFDYQPGGFQPALDAYLDRAAGWGIDVARVPFTWEAVEPTQGSDDAEFLSRYDALLAGLWARGIRSIVDFHQDVYAQVYCGDGFPAWTLPPPYPAPHHDCPDWGRRYLEDADVIAAFDRFWDAGSPVQAEYGSLWDRVAARYANTPGVIGFELFNEPGWGSAAIDPWEQTVLSPFIETMAARVHAVAPNGLVFFEGAGADGLLDITYLERPSGTGLVYAPHYYQLAPDAAKVRPDMKYFVDRATGWNVPVVFGEFGVGANQADAGELMTAHWDALEALGVGGTEWEYSTSTELWNSEHNSVAEADGGENLTASALVRIYLRALAGSGLAVTRAAGSVSWSYIGASGVTEIAVPARAVPNGYDVEATGACVDSNHSGVLLVKAAGAGKPVSVTVRPR